MPNKTIYVSESDLPLYERAQEITGGNLSAAISTALRRLVEVEDARRDGLDEITLRVGPGGAKRQRFFGVLLARWSRTLKDGTQEDFAAYRSRAGKYVLYQQRSESHSWTAGADGTATGWRKHFSQDQQWGSAAATATLSVHDTLEQFRAAAPQALVDLVATVDADPLIEDLDI